MADAYPCSKVNLLSHLSLSELRGGPTSAEGADIWGWTDSRDGREYALMTMTDGTVFVDITNPSNPVVIGNLPTHSEVSLWRDAKVYKNYALIASEANDHGIQLFDLNQLRDVVSPPVTFRNTAHYDGIGTSHNIVVNEESGFAYAVGSGRGTETGCGGGLHMFDISDPLTPTFAHCFGGEGYTHDAQCVVYNGPDSEHAGKEICFASNDKHLSIVDVTTKTVPIALSREDYPTLGYVHQGWLTEDHRYFISNDELDERDGIVQNTHTYIWDVSDLDNVPLPTIHVGPYTNIDHNLYTKGDLLFQAHYRAGLRILDMADIDNGNLTEIGYFDIYPSNNNVGFNGAWSTFPYFASDAVIVSGIEQGLFVLRPAFDAGFRLDASPSRVARCGDEPIQVTLAAEQIAGFDAAIDISAESHPTYTISPTQMTMQPATTQSLQLTSTAATSGTYSLAILGSTLTQTVSTTLLVHQLMIPAPSFPVSGTLDVSLRPVFTWSGDATAQYRFELATEPTFSNPDVNVVVNGTSYQPVNNLDGVVTYYWRVSAETGSCTKSSATNTFTTEASLPVAISHTSNTADSAPRFVWLAALVMTVWSAYTLVRKP